MTPEEARQWLLEPDDTEGFNKDFEIDALVTIAALEPRYAVKVTTPEGRVKYAEYWIRLTSNPERAAWSKAPALGLEAHWNKKDGYTASMVSRLVTGVEDLVDDEQEGGI